MLITDLHSMYVTHPFVIRRLLATSPLCLSSASRLLYISNVQYKVLRTLRGLSLSLNIILNTSCELPSVLLHLLCLLATLTFVGPPLLCP